MRAQEIIDPETAELEQTDDPIEMANLPPSQTGIDGVVFVSTRMGPHGPRVKYYERPGRGRPSFSMSIADDPQIVANSLPQRVAVDVGSKVRAWVLLNKDALLDFWNHGDAWMQPQVEAFLHGLKKLPN
jgi:hypothetical protein